MQRYEPKPWDIRRCSMVRDEQGEYVRYDEAQATIARLTAERDQARAEAAAAYERAANFLETHSYTDDRGFHEMAPNRYRTMGTSQRVAAAAVRALATEPGTTALAAIVKKAVDAETRACAEVILNDCHDDMMRDEEASAILARIDPSRTGKAPGISR